MEKIKKGDLILDLYKVESNGTEGGAALVYKVKQTIWGKEMAMKIPHAAKKEERKKFVRVLTLECARWISIGVHPNIAFCYYTRKIGDTLAVFSEWADEGTLADSIISGKLYNGDDAPRKILRIAIDSMRGLEYAHSCGVVHKDVTPSNIIMTSDGGAKLNDFGLSELRKDDANIPTFDGDPTNAYIYPEQKNGDEITAASDVYSWALTIMTLYIGDVSGKVWGFDGIEAGKNAKKLLTESARIPVPAAMQKLLLKCFSGDAKARPNDADIIKTLEKIYKSEFHEKYPAPFSQAVYDCAQNMDWVLNNRALMCLDLKAVNGKGAEKAAETYWEGALRVSPNHFDSTYNLALFRHTPLPEMLERLKGIGGENKKLYNQIKDAIGSTKPICSYPLADEALNAKLDENDPSKLLVKLANGDVISIDIKTGKTESADSSTEFQYIKGLYEITNDNETSAESEEEEVGLETEAPEVDFEEEDEFEGEEEYKFEDEEEYEFEGEEEYEFEGEEEYEFEPEEEYEYYSSATLGELLGNKTLHYEITDETGRKVQICIQYSEDINLKSSSYVTSIYEIADEQPRLLQKYNRDELYFPIVILPDSLRYISYSSKNRAMELREIPKAHSLKYRLSKTNLINEELHGIDNMLKMLEKAEKAAENGRYKEAAKLVRQLEENNEFRYQWDRFYSLKRKLGAACGKKNFRVLTDRSIGFGGATNSVFSEDYDIFAVFNYCKINIYTCDGTLIKTFDNSQSTVLNEIERSLEKDGASIIFEEFDRLEFSGSLCEIRSKVNGDDYPIIVYDLEEEKFVAPSLFPEIKNEEPSDEDKKIAEQAWAEVRSDIGERQIIAISMDGMVFVEKVSDDFHLVRLDFDLTDDESDNVFTKLDPPPRYRLSAAGSTDPLSISTLGKYFEEGFEEAEKAPEETGPLTDENAILEPNEHNLIKLADIAAKLVKMRDKLISTVIGQEHAVEIFTQGLFRSLIRGSEEHRGPKAIFFFAGPPGVGKTMLSKAAGEALDMEVITFNMTEYSAREAAESLIGFDSTYRNASEGRLTKQVREHPNCILIFDEVEKADMGVMHLFYQMLDEGYLTDKYVSTLPDKDKNGKEIEKPDPKVSFKDTIVIFTSNVGRAIYENENYISGANISTQELLNVIRTEKSPQTGGPFCPSALVSRISTGYPILFNNHIPSTLLKIIQNKFDFVSDSFSSKYGIKLEADPAVITSLLFREGGKTDARMISARAENFVYDELYKISALNYNALRRTKRIRFINELDGADQSIKELYENSVKLNILVCADDKFLKSKVLENYNILAAHNVEEALALSKGDIDIAIVEIIPANVSEEKRPAVDPLKDRTFYTSPLEEKTYYTAPSAKRWGDTNRFFKTLRESRPEIPIYVLENTGSNIGRELIMSFIRDGAKGALKYGEGADIDAALADISLSAHMQTAANTMALGHRRLDFETVFTEPVDITGNDENVINVKLRNFRLVRSSAGDEDKILNDAEKPTERFKDVIGAEAAKKALQDYIDYFKNPRKYCMNGLRKAPKGVLLYGPPGTGKTMLAKAMAGECGVGFLPVSAATLVSGSSYGYGASAVKNLFSYARKYAPSIIFIDEVDVFAQKRSGGGSANELINTFLTEMDGFKTDPKRPVFVLAATNLYDSLDEAFTRRFDRHICVDLPDCNERKELIEKFIADLKENNPDIDIDEQNIIDFAKITNGISPAILRNILQNAVQDAYMNKKKLGEEHLDGALGTYMFGEKRKHSDAEKKQTACHESGHALINFLCGYIPPYLTIESRGSFGGYMQHSEEEIKIAYKTKTDLLNSIRCSLGGRAAEIVCNEPDKRITTGPSNDLSQATQVAYDMIVKYGMDDEFGMAVLPADSDNDSKEIRSRINAILKSELENAIRDIEDHREQFDRLVAALLDKENLTGEDINQILSGSKPDPKSKERITSRKAKKTNKFCE